MKRPTIHVHRRRSRLLHPWVFSNEVERVEGDPQSGDTVCVVDRGARVGNALYSPHSLIRARIFDREDRELDVPLLVERIRMALALRRDRLPAEDDYRLLHGESDQVPGLVVDKYGAHFVVRAYASGIGRRLEQTVEALRALFPVESVSAASDFRLREEEGLEIPDQILFGSVPATQTIHEGGVAFSVDLQAGQKTGFYFDQRITRRQVRELSPGRSVLDVFCYTGGFALNAALGGAREAIAIDSSEPACAAVKINAELNGVGERVVPMHGDGFTLLRRLNAEGRKFDLIVLDPPPFVKRLRELRDGLKAYRDINYQAMKLLAPGGALVSCSCSHHVTWGDLIEVLGQAAQGCGREFQVMERIGAGPDHPVLLNMPETEYLRCYRLDTVS